ncbi:5'/3'-nucleotidase SurE [Clostridium niameyense]|uniref:5'-nucleotidase SurE n=1 Tax=Clostridium niameyense TaxID=1622073 RepID=A0A6M0RA83_9CLOT|nr:5'/3'-nucleotidase SurE [Clostridium niameyense]NEZ47116.1 5'/3'-nucleotidase SurE [Clostridium niameyense]
MNILLTNDDGINAEGIKVLAKSLYKYHNVVVVAPMEQRSASSHSITINESIIVKKDKIEGLDVEAYSISGTPADCVRVALDKLVKDKIDIVISGINRGVNIGNSILYSGTVSAAIEGSMYELPSIAVSTEIVKGKQEDYQIAAKYLLKILQQSSKNYLRNDVVLNLNIPYCKEEDIKGIKICKIGNKVYNSYFVEDDFVGNNRAYKLTGNINEDISEDTDVYYIRNKYVTLTPLHYDLTNFNILSEMTKILK